MEKNEIVLFKEGQLELNVQVSPDEETVWLSLKDMCSLFNRDKSIISRILNL